MPLSDRRPTQKTSWQPSVLLRTSEGCTTNLCGLCEVALYGGWRPREGEKRVADSAGKPADALRHLPAGITEERGRDDAQRSELSSLLVVSRYPGDVGQLL